MKNLLANLGFSEYESKVLLYLIEAKQYVDAKQLASGSGVPLTRIYSIMLKLAKQGLIRTAPGKTNLYAAPNHDELVKAIRAMKEKQIEEQKASADKTCSFLSKRLSAFRAAVEEVNVTYFHDNEAYWKEYIKEDKALRKGDIQRVINNVRLCASFIDEELAGMPREQAAVMHGESLHGTVEVWYIINPKSLVQTILSSLTDKRKVAESLRKMLRELKTEAAYSRIYTSEDTSRILIGINPRCVFMEFYGEDSRKILSAIKIESANIAKDFAKWFDALAATCQKSGYSKFEKEIKKWAEKLGKISL